MRFSVSVCVCVCARARVSLLINSISAGSRVASHLIAEMNRITWILLAWHAVPFLLMAVRLGRVSAGYSRRLMVTRVCYRYHANDNRQDGNGRQL